MPRLVFNPLLAPLVFIVTANAHDSSLRGANPQSMENAPGDYLVTRHSEGESGEHSSGKRLEHLGCFGLEEDDIFDRVQESHFMTPMMCHEHCQDLGADFMATHEGTECWCGNEWDQDSRQNDFGVCDSICEGDDTRTCGGSRSFDIYEVKRVFASSDPEYLGCYKNVQLDHIMGIIFNQADMTPEVCREHCLDDGASTHYGIQNGSECRCGVSSGFSYYTVHGEGICHAPCSGDTYLACGGFNALSMFELIMDMGVGDTIDETPGERWDRSSGENRYDPFGRGGRDRSRRKKRHRESGGGDFSERGGGGVLVKGNYRGPSVDRDGASEGAAILPSAGTGDQLFAGGGRKGMNELLLIHNIVRCIHNAEPLVWDDMIEKSAEAHAAILSNSANCGSLEHSKSNPYGENLYMCGNTAKNCYSPRKAMTALYTSELTDSVTSYGGHATAVLWKATKMIGCAVDTCNSNGMLYYILVCNFDPPGNYRNALQEQVELPSKTPEQCGF